MYTSAESRRSLVLGAVLAVVLLAGCGSGGGASAKPPASPAGASATPEGPPPAPAVPAPRTGPPSPTGPPAVFTQVAAQAGRPVMKTSLHGPKSDVTMNVWTWTPPEYDDPRYAGSSFPVLVLFPGGEGNNYNTWIDNAQLGLQTALTDMAKTGKSHPFILVMPSMALSKALETECSDIPGQPKVGTWITEDVRDMVLANFRANPDPKAWGIMGGSSGGFCAAKLALQRPDRFAAAVPIGAYFIPDSKLWHGKGPEWEANNPSLLAQKAAGPTKLLLVVGGSALEEQRVAKNFVPLVKPPVSLERWDNPGAEHLTKDFKRAVPLALEFFTKNLAGPTPPPTN